MPRYDQKFIACDTETGGLPDRLKKKATIDVALTEVAIVTIENEFLKITDKKSWLIKPYDDQLIYEKGAEIASGISKGLCQKEGVDIKQAYEGMKEAFKKGKSGRNKPILIFHNKSFDTPFIENLFLLFEDNLYEYIDRVEDTMQWARLKWIEKPKFTLGATAEHYGLDHVQAHRALPDTVTTAEIWIKLMKDLRGMGQTNGSSELVKENKFRVTFKF